ncbi:MAG: MFS transporter [Firmicutes bacterium]|nr:MFS transporter [Bacillota bacterium]
MTTAPDAPPASVPGARRNITVLGFTSSYLNFAVQCWNPVVPILLVREGAPNLGVVVTYALVNLLGAAAQYAGGRLADRYGARLLIAIPTTFAGLMWVVMALSPDWQVMAASYVAINIVFGIQNPSFTTMVADSVPPTERLAAFARYNLIVSPGYVLGPLLGAFVILPHVPPPLFIGATGLSYVAVGLTRLRLFVEPRRDLPRRPPAPGGFRAAVREARAAVLGSPTRRRLLAVTVGVSSLVALTVNGPFLALVGHAQDGLAPQAVDILFAVGAVGMVGVGLFAGGLTRRLGDRAALAAGLVLHGAAVAAYAVRMGLGAGVGVFVLLFAGYQLSVIAFGALRSEWASGPDAGAAIGGTSALAGVAVFLVLSLAGSVEAAFGRGGPLLLAGAVALGTAALALMPDGAGGAEAHRRPWEGRPAAAAVRS